MDLLDITILIHLFIGALAYFGFMYDRGEVLVKDFIYLPVAMLFGIMWILIFWLEREARPNCFDNITLHLVNLGNKKLWRSKASIAKEVLYGNKKDKYK